MKPLVVATISALLLAPLFACSSARESVPAPPPLPAMPTPRSAAPEEPAVVEGPTAVQAEHAKAPSKASKRDKLKKAKQQASAPPAKPAEPVVSKPAARARAKPAAPPPAPAKSKVTIPRTAHVSIDVPAGLQADLDKDPRMQPWANQVVNVADRCQTQNASAVGTIEVLITMHENARPDADIKKLPSVLSPIVACATGGLMRIKVPLFTGNEGTRYTVKINFTN